MLDRQVERERKIDGERYKQTGTEIYIYIERDRRGER